LELSGFRACFFLIHISSLILQVLLLLVMYTSKNTQKNITAGDVIILLEKPNPEDHTGFDRSYVLNGMKKYRDMYKLETLFTK